VDRIRTDSVVARRTLEDISRLQNEGLRRIASVWFPLYVFGCIYLGVAPLAVIIHRDHLAPYFLVCLCIGSVLTARHYRRRGDADGLVTKVAPWLATSILMTVGGGVASFTGFVIGSTFLDTAGPFLVVASFFFAFAVLARSRLLVFDAFAMVLFCAISGGFSSGNDRIAVQAVLYGILLLGTARFQQIQERSAA
jgi:hypothetical protein